MAREITAAIVARRLEELRALCELTNYLRLARLVVPSHARDEQPSQPRIRRVEERDLVAVRGVLVDTWHHAYDALLGAERVTEMTDSWHAIARLRGQLDRKDDAFLLVELEGIVVATGSADRRDDVVTVHRLYVLPARQGTGVGTTLLEALIAAVGPAARVELRVLAANTPAIAFYEARGFTVCGRDGDDLVMQRTRPAGR